MLQRRQLPMLPPLPGLSFPGNDFRYMYFPSAALRQGSGVGLLVNTELDTKTSEMKLMKLKKENTLPACQGMCFLFLFYFEPGRIFFLYCF